MASDRREEISIDDHDDGQMATARNSPTHSKKNAEPEATSTSSCYRCGALEVALQRERNLHYMMASKVQKANADMDDLRKENAALRDLVADMRRVAQLEKNCALPSNTDDVVGTFLYRCMMVKKANI